MGNDTKYFLIPASSGLCIHPNSSKTETAAIQGNENQLWQIEQGKKNKIAFRNVESGEYLRACGGNKSNAVKLGARQWWTLETSDTPNAFWIKCDDYSNAYLCNSYGNITPSNTIYMWAKEDYWAQTMLWYISDYDSWTKHRSSKPDIKSLTASPENNANGDVESALKEAEEKQRELEDKLKVAEDKQRELESKEKDGKDGLQLEEREKELAVRERDLEAKKNAAAAKEKDLEDRERAIAEKAPSADTNDGDSSQELQELRDRLASVQTDAKQKEVLKNRLEAKETEFSKLKQAYDDLKRNRENGNAGTVGLSSDRSSIIGRRVHSSSEEDEAARVGSRNMPLGLRTRDTRRSTTRGRLEPIQLQRKFSNLPRLRSS